MPEKTLKKLNSYILPTWKICFFAALFIGLIAHLYKITNWLPNWDSLVFRYDSQNMIALGRWFLPVACSFSSFYDLPFLNGIIAIVFYALGAVCICEIFNIKKKITAFLIGSLIVSFPTVTSTLMYNYVADGYSIAFFLATLAALLLTKKKPNYVVASLLIALSIGIYQAYITVTITLILLKLIEELLYNKAAFGMIFKKTSFILISGVVGSVIYVLVLNILLKTFSIELIEYQGVSSTASLSAIDIGASLYVIKETFFNFFFNFTDGINLHSVLNIVVFVITIVLYTKHFINNKLYKKPASVILTLALVGLLLLGSGALALINPRIDYHNLMIMGYSSFLLCFVLLYERTAKSTEKHIAIKRWIVLLVSLVIIANQIVIANVSYHKAGIAYEKTYGVLIRIADRIEQTEGHENCDKILVLGALDNSDNYSVSLPPHITGITDGYIIRSDDETVAQSVLTSALNDYCGEDYEFLMGEEKKVLAQTETVKAMEKWPAKNSIAIEDNTIIIKLGNQGEN